VKRLSYIASPYTHDSEKIRELRAQQAMDFAARIRAAGRFVFSPIAHSHEMSEYLAAYGCPVKTDAFWREENELMLSRCDALVVVRLAGWERSIGVQREIEFAQASGIPVELMDY